MSIHLSIKAKPVVTAEAKQELKSTMEEFNRACNTLSELAFQQDLHRKYDIHHAGYYKAARAGVEVVYIDPRYTSQTCSRCLHIGVRQNQSSFHCRDCGYQINADLNGAKSIALRHDLVAMGRLFCEYPPKKVSRPEAIRSSVRKRQVRNLESQAPSIIA